MTSRNLNTTWRDVVFIQYKYEYEADVLFPIRYLIYAGEWKTDIFIEIPTKIPLEHLHRSIGHFCRARHRKDPAYQDDNISIRARVRHPSHPRRTGEPRPDHEQDAPEDPSSPGGSGGSEPHH